jgi:hypothetical protein
LNSTSEAHPNGLGNASQLGHNLMDHHFRCGASGSAEGFEDKYTYGRRANMFQDIKMSETIKETI